MTLKILKKTFIEIDFSHEKIMNAISDITSVCATGPDGVPAKLMKMAAEPIAKMLEIIAKTLQDCQTFRVSFKHTFILGAYKGG